MSITRVKVENLAKQYRLGEVGTGTLSHDLNRFWHKIRGKEDPYSLVTEQNDRTAGGDSDYVWAIQDINFEVKEGEVLGIIGRNGAGKSTLLKVLSQVTGPTKGVIKLNGRIGSLLEVGTGMHPELTGKENIYLNGAILGMSKADVSQKFDEIVEFAGIARYVNTPFKRYSSGMRVRLGFAVAAFLEPEILIVDEVLAVGDAEFQKKAIGKLQDVSKEHGRTVLFVSHNMAAVRNLCTRGLVLDNGKISFMGKTDDAIAHYLNNNDSSTDLKDRTDRIGGESFKFTDVRLISNQEKIISECISGDTVKIQIHYASESPIKEKDFHWGISLLDKYGSTVFAFSSIESGIRVSINESTGFLTWEIPQLPLRGGQYYLRLFASKDTTNPEDTLDQIENAFVLVVHPGDYWKKGVTNRPGEELLINSRLY